MLPGASRPRCARKRSTRWPPSGRGAISSPRSRGSSWTGTRDLMTRLDVWLAEHGLAASREKAQALVMAGRVTVDGQRAAKPGTRVRDGVAVAVEAGPAHV